MICGKVVKEYGFLYKVPYYYKKTSYKKISTVKYPLFD